VAAALIIFQTLRDLAKQLHLFLFWAMISVIRSNKAGFDLLKKCLGILEMWELVRS
jgi:hypothetical protein